MNDKDLMRLVRTAASAIGTPEGEPIEAGGAWDQLVRLPNGEHIIVGILPVVVEADGTWVV